MKRVYRQQYQLFFCLFLVLIASMVACKENTTPLIAASSSTTKIRQAATDSSMGNKCPATGLHKGAFPNVLPKYQTAAYWLSVQNSKELDVPLLSKSQIAQQNRAVGRSGNKPISQWNLLTPLSDTELSTQLQTRLKTISTLIRNETLIAQNGQPVPIPLRRFLTREKGALRSSTQKPVWQVALQHIQMRCVPYDGALYRSKSDNAFDKNACSSIHPQEPLEILGSWSNNMLFVRTPYAFGFIAPNANRSPEIPEQMRSSYMNAPTMWATVDTSLQCNDETISIPQFTFLPTLENKLMLAGKTAFCNVPATAAFSAATRPLTRRAFYESAFKFLGTAYGYGGTNGGLDCSRFVMELLSTFNFKLPRNSNHQSQAGSFSLDVSQLKDLAQKEAYLDAAHKQGVVALYFPGHIMFYLGRTQEGVPMAIHSLGEYASPCTETDMPDDETVFRVKRVVVTDLSLGQGSSRRSFFERLTKIVIFGNDPGEKLKHLVSHRPAEPPVLPTEQCHDSVELRIFQSPRRLIKNETARLIATSSKYLRRAKLQIYDAQGSAIPTAMHQLGGPPYTVWTEFTPLSRGKYTAVLGDGDTVLACDHFGVGQYRSKKKARTAPEAYWQSRWKWEQDTENLFSAFIEQLFQFPRDADVSWNGLHTLLNDPKQNLLYNHLGEREDEELNLSPDCADLPYFLRAYFAWKTSLPFGVRSCSRGRKGRSPSCTQFQTNDLEAPVEEQLNSETKIFDRFVNIIVGWSAHSASGRTHPKFNETDFYPVELSRKALVPGTIFADPYGHIMIISKWYPQPLGGYGVLMAVDGQPDGTIGRRRFWKGTFLFDAATESFGAGFKRFRPVVYEKVKTETDEQSVPKTLSNRELQRSRVFSKYSVSQYDNGTDAFYDKMQLLINPTPLNAEDLLRSRIDALEESVKRRVQAIANGEAYMAERGFEPIDMPVGDEIFQTEGPWENYSTPSRDMRLLIAIDAVMETPKKVLQHPKQYGIPDDEKIERVVSHLQELLEKELETRFIKYTRSDGTNWKLSLENIVERQTALEMAYNPNNCIEQRWGAPIESDEYATCNRRAPEKQVEKEVQYRNWFHSRKRPQTK